MVANSETEMLCSDKFPNSLVTSTVIRNFGKYIEPITIEYNRSTKNNWTYTIKIDPKLSLPPVNITNTNSDLLGSTVQIKRNLISADLINGQVVPSEQHYIHYLYQCGNDSTKAKLDLVEADVYQIKESTEKTTYMLLPSKNVRTYDLERLVKNT